jgi:hypothetical protein
MRMHGMDSRFDVDCDVHHILQYIRLRANKANNRPKTYRGRISQRVSSQSQTDLISGMKMPVSAVLGSSSFH